MLKKLGWGLVALTMLAGLARAAGGSDGGMSVNTLSTNITTALTTLINAINTNFIQGGVVGNLSTDVIHIGNTKTDPAYTAPLTAPPNLGSSGTISAAGGNLSIPTGTLNALGIQISGTFVATLSATCSMDNDLTAPVAKSFVAPGGAAVPSVSGAGNWVIKPGACDHIRITATAWTSGTITVTWVQANSIDEVRPRNVPQDPLATADAGSSNTAFGTAPAVATGTALLAKNTDGNFYGAYATNLSSANTGFLAVIAASAVPTGTSPAITPIECVPYGTFGGSIGYAGVPPKAITGGIVVLLTTDPGCSKYTPGSLSAFLSASVK